MEPPHHRHKSPRGGHQRAPGTFRNFRHMSEIKKKADGTVKRTKVEAEDDGARSQAKSRTGGSRGEKKATHANAATRK